MKRNVIMMFGLLFAVVFGLSGCGGGGGGTTSSQNTPTSVSDVNIGVDFSNSANKVVNKVVAASTGSSLLKSYTPKKYSIALKSATLIGNSGIPSHELFNHNQLSEATILNFTANDSILQTLNTSGTSIPAGSYHSIKMAIYYLQMTIEVKLDDAASTLVNRNIRIYYSDDGVHRPGDVTEITDSGTERGWLMGTFTSDFTGVTPRTIAYQNNNHQWLDFAGKSAQSFGPFGDTTFWNNATAPYTLTSPFSFSTDNGGAILIKFNVTNTWNCDDRNADGYFNPSDIGSSWHMTFPPISISREATSSRPPSAPTEVTAVAGDSRSTITWKASVGATSYNMYYSLTSGVTKTNGTKVPGVSSPYAVQSLTNGTAYYFVVTAVNANGESSLSSEVNATPGYSGPARKLLYLKPNLPSTWTAVNQSGSQSIEISKWIAAGYAVDTKDLFTTTIDSSLLSNYAVLRINAYGPGWDGSAATTRTAAEATAVANWVNAGGMLLGEIGIRYTLPLYSSFGVSAINGNQGGSSGLDWAYHGAPLNISVTTGGSSIFTATTLASEAMDMPVLSSGNLLTIDAAINNYPAVVHGQFGNGKVVVTFPVGWSQDQTYPGNAYRANINQGQNLKFLGDVITYFNQLPPVTNTGGSTDYYPLQVGNKWVYTSLVPGKYRNDEVTGTEIVNGSSTFIKERLEPSPDNYHEKRWLAYDSSSVLLLRFWGNEGADPSFDLSPSGIEYKLSPQVGDKWSLLFASMNFEVLSLNDTVTVPAGTFTNCIKIKDSNTVSGKVHLVHYAPGIGMIRNEQPGVWVEELVFAKVGTKSYGTAPL